MKNTINYKIPENFYGKLINRNIGLVSQKEQEKIRNSLITIFGVGGLGGPVSEQLVRSGCEKLILCDNDFFEITDLNRQICTIDDIGKRKIEVTEQFLKKINPNINIETFFTINKNNISKMLNDSDIVLLTLDDPITSILIAREARNRNIPLLESWGIPFLWAWWFTNRSVDYETCYGFPTKNSEIDEIFSSENISKIINNRIFDKLLTFPKMKERYNREENALNKVIAGTSPLISMAPIVRMTSSFLAFETIFSGILEIKKKTLAPKIIGFDYFEMIPINL